MAFNLMLCRLDDNPDALAVFGEQVNADALVFALLSENARNRFHVGRFDVIDT